VAWSDVEIDMQGEAVRFRREMEHVFGTALRAEATPA